MIFVDTSAWFALAVTWDERHRAAVDWAQTNRETMVTTDYVVAETLTLMKVRGAFRRVDAFIDEVSAGKTIGLHRIDERDFQTALTTFRHFSDKDWSFTDCTSKVVMERLGITTAFAFDHHFRQFGNVTVVP